MTVFADASALAAIFGEEQDAFSFIDTVASGETLRSPMSRWETISSSCRSHDFTLERARGDLAALGSTVNIRTVGIGIVEDEAALDASQRYGKGRHPAKLSMGDCLAHACAKTNRARLLYEGDDFSRTDLA